MTAATPRPTPATGVDIWLARLDTGHWPGAAGLPAAERTRAARLLREEARRRWVAARWALREVLARYLEADPATIELRLGERGKPGLADPAAPLRFNLSHSGGLALVAVAEGREVGVDIERLGRRPAGFYAEWTRREAVAKCHGTGLGGPPASSPVAVESIEAPPGFAAALAVAGDRLPPLRRLMAAPEVRRRPEHQ